MLAVEQARSEASLEARTNADLLASRLNALERALQQEREEQRLAERKASRAFTTIATVAFGLGLCALILTVVLQNRGMNRLAEIALAARAGWSPGVPVPGALADGSGPLLLGGRGEREPSGGDRLLTTISRLEKHVHDLERSAQVPSASAAASGSETVNGTDSTSAQNAPGTRSTDPVRALLGKGQTLLHLGEAEKALQCFDEAIALSPENADAHLKRGFALEKLQRTKEALAAYDRVMVLSRSHSLAALRKAEILTQEERFAEALECYEQALRSEEKP